MEAAQVEPGRPRDGRGDAGRPDEAGDVRIQGIVTEIGRPLQGKGRRQGEMMRSGDIALMLPVMVVIRDGHGIPLRVSGVMGPEFRPLAAEPEPVARAQSFPEIALHEKIAVLLAFGAQRDRFRPADHRPGIAAFGQVAEGAERPFPPVHVPEEVDVRPQAREVAVFPDERRVIAAPAPVVRLEEMPGAERITAVRGHPFQGRAEACPLACTAFPSH